LKRCRHFLAGKDRVAVAKAAEAIDRQFRLLRTNPEIGRPFADEPYLRELVIAFGDSGYLALYRYLPENDTVYVLAFRHQKEAGY
jgi:plasmid stabilization system protein ParE